MIRPSTPFYLIRHGLTDWNVEGRFQGQTDIPMNDLGRQQAIANGNFLATLGHDWKQWDFVASPLGRTRETMKLVRSQIGLPTEGFMLDDRLLELTFGDWEGSTLAELELKVPQQVQARYDDKWGYRQPNGESYGDGSARVTDFLAGLQTPTVVVSHGGVIRIVRYLLEGLDKQHAAETETPQDKIYYFDGTKAHWLT